MLRRRVEREIELHQPDLQVIGFYFRDRVIQSLGLFRIFCLERKRCQSLLEPQSILAGEVVGVLGQFSQLGSQLFLQFRVVVALILPQQILPSGQPQEGAVAQVVFGLVEDSSRSIPFLLPLGQLRLSQAKAQILGHLDLSVLQDSLGLQRPVLSEKDFRPENGNQRRFWKKSLGRLDARLRRFPVIGLFPLRRAPQHDQIADDRQPRQFEPHDMRRVGKAQDVLVFLQCLGVILDLRQRLGNPQSRTQVRGVYCGGTLIGGQLLVGFAQFLVALPHPIVGLFQQGGAVRNSGRACSNILRALSQLPRVNSILA